MINLDLTTIDKRINYLKNRKKLVLSQPKTLRSDSLQYLDKTISRLKKWKNELTN